ncbi:hypothetical protein AU152_gp32 [Mycobacterium phage Phlei]|uniref:Uncharacterized protein n=1 Tax=Mycobacterium phage Phlei TaxID=1690684 RepID=A0A0N6WN47_9CAUD|nr:hypothetical protein AU152_gp32 [Mycobacterium phage Phlei]ALA48145.1 hypothetical protein [Mycobacterium phage Phlei]
MNEPEELHIKFIMSAQFGLLSDEEVRTRLLKVAWNEASYVDEDSLTYEIQTKNPIYIGNGRSFDLQQNGLVMYTASVMAVRKEDLGD